MFSLLLVPTFAAAVTALALPYTCVQQTLPVSISTQATTFNIGPPANQTALMGFVTSFTSSASNLTAQVISGKTSLSATYNIFTELCIPNRFPVNGTLEFAIHGINFDHTYWTLGGKGSPSNYVESAINAGHAIMIIDRLGEGGSSTPNGLTEVQLSTQVEIAAQLVAQLRSGVISPHRFGKIVGIGHSFGSIQLATLAARHGNVLDALVLTGYTISSANFPATFAGWGFTLANTVTNNGVIDNAYIKTESTFDDQLTNIYYPHFDNSILTQANTVVAGFTIGEILTLAESGEPATSYTGPVHIVTGDKDYIFCGGNCFQSLNGFANLLEPIATLFPAASSFSTNIPANTGHGVNLHLSAPETYSQIQAWIDSVL